MYMLLKSHVLSASFAWCRLLRGRWKLIANLAALAVLSMMSPVRPARCSGVTFGTVKARASHMPFTLHVSVLRIVLIALEMGVKGACGLPATHLKPIGFLCSFTRRW